MRFSDYNFSLNFSESQDSSRYSVPRWVKLLTVGLLFIMSVHYCSLRAQLSLLETEGQILRENQKQQPLTEMTTARAAGWNDLAVKLLYWEEGRHLGVVLKNFEITSQLVKIEGSAADYRAAEAFLQYLRDGVFAIKIKQFTTVKNDEQIDFSCIWGF